MGKYRALISVSWQNGFVYRASLFLWRFRQFLSSFFSLTIWTVLYQNTSSSFGYDQDQMIGYIFITSVIQSLVLSTSLNGLTSTIYSGELSLLLVKPIGLFRALAAQEIADKTKNVLFSVAELAVLFILFQPKLTLLFSASILLAILWILAGVFIHFFISLLFGAIGFWSPESWGPRFLFFTVVNFVGGKYFPLDILPKTLQTLIWLTPFPFLSFAQSQLLLSRLDNTQVLLASVGVVFWLLFLGLITKKVWQEGLKNYSASGQ